MFTPILGPLWTGNVLTQMESSITSVVPWLFPVLEIQFTPSLFCLMEMNRSSSNHPRMKVARQGDNGGVI